MVGNTNPINPPNDRVAGFCQAVLVKDRITTLTGGDENPASDSKVLKGVQSVGVSRTVERESFTDIGRYGNEYGRYAKTVYTINISRVVSKSKDFFLTITEAGLSTDALNNYLNGHMFSVASDKTIGVDGIPIKGGADRGLKNYDITLMYGRDDLSSMNEPFPPPDIGGTTGINHTTYRACLLTNISYTIPINGSMTEELTFTCFAYTQNDETDPANWIYLRNQAEDGFVHSLEEEPSPNDQFITNPNPGAPDWPYYERDINISNPDYKAGPFSVGGQKEYTFRRQDLSIDECEFPVEIIEAFQIKDQTMFDDKTQKEVPIMGIQQIEINIDIPYSDPINIGSWRGDGHSAAYSRTMSNLYRQVELPVGVSCTFTGVVRAQYFTKFEFNKSAGAGYDTYSTTKQNHEITDTYHTAGVYGDETKNANYDGVSPPRFVEQYKADREIKLVMHGLDPTIPDGRGPNPEKFQLNLGKRNYITSFEVTGGDADGGNVEVSMSFQNDWAEFFLFKNLNVLDFEAPSTDPTTP
jgi:hypothetical protein